MQQQPPSRPPYGGMDENRIDINLIAMLLWQSLLTGTAVAVSHLNWYLADAGQPRWGCNTG